LADVVTWTFTAGDGYRWHYRHYPPPGPPSASVVCLHGIQSHGGWYAASCRSLQAAGCDVYFLDRRGSGLNPEARGDAPSYRRLLDDVREFLQTRPGPGRPPLFLLAISWGGKIGAGIATRCPGLVDGLILLTPGFCPRIRPTPQERRDIIRSRLLAPAKLFPIPLSDPALFTATLKWQKFIAEDSLTLHHATARFLVESRKFDLYLNRSASRVNIPLLLTLAGKDRIVDNERTRRFVERFASPEKTVIEYPEAHHTLEFEPDPQPIFADVKNWIAKFSRESSAARRAR
jgi:alpha-beta hydrolase superfamily lysophospholipase